MERRTLRIPACAVVLGALVACSDQQTTGPGAIQLDPAQSQVAPLYTAGPGQEAVPSSYIVAFEKDAPNVRGLAERLVREQEGELVAVYETALKGFTAKLNDRAVEALRRNPHVEYVEVDTYVKLAATQNNATWGLDRIDQRDRPLSGTYTYNTTASGVNAYIIDTGIKLNHSEFGGRARTGYDAFGGSADDCNGHGTHVAGTVGGTTYGVAKSVRLYAIKVLDCNGSGSNSGVIAGVDWVTRNHVKPAVANMSLGGGASTALDNAVKNSIAAGVTYAVAAGNENQNACNVSPARAGTAITVASSTSSDARSSFSNWGSCVDIFAPGSSITSAWHTGGTNTISGTSMASPHVAGAAALYLAQNPGATPLQVTNALVTTATQNKISGVNGSPNLLLYSLFSGGTNPDPDPTPDPTEPCTSCQKFTGSLSGAGDYDYQPNGTYYRTTSSGYHKGWLRGPSSADYDLYLWKWNGWSWGEVAKSVSSTSEEAISYYGTAGYYVFRIISYSGSGSYSFWVE